MASTSSADQAADGSDAVRTALASRVLLADGAMGTMLFEKGVATAACLEQLNLIRPDLVRSLHEQYVEAGADILQTNTFGANGLRLGGFDLDQKVDEINVAGVGLARDAAAQSQRPVFVAGAIGPLDAPLSRDEAAEIFREQAAALMAAGVDLFSLETFTSLDEALAAVACVRAVARDAVIVAEMSFDENGAAGGVGPQDVAQALSTAGADVVGANCGDGPKQAQRLLQEMAQAGDLTLAVQPNAGIPKLVNRRVLYTTTAEEMSEYALRYVAHGATIVGGCCGTTPRHIAAMRHALAGEKTPSVSVPTAAGSEAVKTAGSSGLREKLAAGQLVVGVEIDPPRGLSMKRTLAAAAMLKEAGADFANIGDSLLAEVRMGPIATARLILEETGLETVVHYLTRDRNVMALQSDLLGAHALGLRNVLCIKGDPHALGSYTKATAVWDVSALGLMRLLKGFNAGADVMGNEVSPPARFLVGAAVNPGAEDLEAEAALFRRKIAAGADFFLSQAVFSSATLERFLEKVGPDHPPLILGIWPIHSQRQAAFLDRHITKLPAEIRMAIEGAGDGAELVGFELANELILASASMAQGYYLIPSFRRFEEVTGLLQTANGLTKGAGPRPA